jgi:hypothetical protein
MKLLTNIDLANEYFDTEEHSFFVDVPGRKSVGFYKNCNQVISAIFADNGGLFIRVSDKMYEITEDCAAELTKCNNLGWRFFSLFREKALVMQFTYLTEYNYSHIPPFEFLDDEEFDWGEFLKNVVNSEERKKIFIEVNQ